ncbi:MAG: hypothetical protein QOE42_1868 [Chloroflexota bacterium]|nr:hypothetical protein [Chloroflexota bacterium]
MVEAGLHGSDGRADDLGDLRERKSRVVMQDEDRAMLRRQPQERAIEGVPVVDRDGRVDAARSVDRQRADSGDPSPVTPVLLVTGIDEEPTEPRREALRVTEPGELTPREEECLLDGVLGAFDIAKDPVRDGVALVAVQVDQLPEGDIVAVAGLFDQPRPHERVSSGAVPALHPLLMVAPGPRFNLRVDSVEASHDMPPVACLQ